MADMAETKKEKSDTEKKPLTLSRPGKLELKKTVEKGVVQQSFSHGRSKSVQVEVKRTRTYARGTGGKMAEVTDEATPDLQDAHLDASNLSDTEREARRRALEDATFKASKQADEGPEEAVAAHEESAETEETVDAVAEAEAEAEVEVEAETEAETEATVEAETEAPAPVEAAIDPKTEARQRERQEADTLARELAGQQMNVGLKISDKKAPARATPPPRAPEPAEAGPVAEEAEDTRARRGKEEARKRPTPARTRGEPKRREGRLTISDALAENEGISRERQRSLAAVRRSREREKQRQRQVEQGPIQHRQIVREVTIPEALTVQELSNRMAEKAGDVIKTLMKMDIMATVTQTIDADTAELVVAEFGHNVKRVSESDVEIGISGDDDNEGDMQSRPPIVTVMGHVDHGKTSLLDAIRATDVAGREAGGITQHIGAYQVVTAAGNRISFIDTPGHAAFTAMRARGANVTDIVILVVAADDGVQPQTIEAISHAKAAEVPIIVAINKMDAPGADADRVRTELLQHDIQVEQMGGDVLAVEVSAKEGTGLDQLEEAVVLQAELLELKANPEREAQGIVVEARLEKGRGSVATVLVQKGSLKAGDVFVAGAEWGKVRALINDRGEPVDEAGPAIPVEVLGFNGTPAAGDNFSVIIDGEGRAREISEYRQREVKKSTGPSRSSVEQMFSQIQAGEAQSLPIVIKGDVQGSVEAIIGMLEDLSTDEVAVNILHTGVGGINESDITLAGASGGMIIAFNVRASTQARELAAQNGIDIRYYSVIYDINDDMKGMLSGMLAPEIRETFLGYAEILEVFKVSKVGNVAGCRVTDGVVASRMR
jgi:translation initiation factor IF-2